MTNIFKYLPRCATLPQELVVEAGSSGIDLTELNDMLDLYGSVKGKPSEEAQQHYASLLSWYTKAIAAYEAKTDPNGLVAARRSDLIRRDFDALCPSIPTIDAAQFEELGDDRKHYLNLIFLYSSPGCPHCIPLAETLEALSREVGDVRMLKICQNLEPRFFERFCITALPTVLLFKRKSLKGITQGNQPIEQMREWIEQTVRPYQARLERRREAARVQTEPQTAEDVVCIDGVCEIVPKNDAAD
jgi:thiol-disulfide isomerase/thioredoxin